MQAVEQGYECVLPGLAARKPRNLLEMQTTGPPTRPTESQTLGRIQQSVVLTSSPVFLS